MLAAPIAAGPVVAEPAQDAAETASIDMRRQSSRAEYERVAGEISLSTERLSRLAAEIAAVKKDSVDITAALIQAAKTEKKLTEDIDAIEQRLSVLKAQEADAKASLLAQQDVLADVLGALERMGLNPPPAVLVRPDDALASIRSAILLGAVVPGLRERTDAMMADFQRLSRVTKSIGSERDGMRTAVEAQLVEKRRLDILLEQKRKLRHDSEATLSAERARVAELASRAGSLKELLATLDAEAQKRKAAEEAAASEPAAAGAGVETAAAPAQPPESTQVAMQLPDANLLLGPQSFESLEGQIASPVSGHFVKRFGRSDGNGGVMQGDTVATQSDAIVTAPADGDVLYAGPFRSYGQLLILNVGSGYHVLLAGMSRINVAPGQSVLAGEPVGAMGDAKVASAAAGVIGNAAQELYIEFRKDGKPVDPAPWWAKRLSGRTGNDT
ncbi:MAG: murein hydrolase activator EnvC [Rhizobiales bacterium]|nr:murein hydrolase activator EnvC [Hyphomicrobiales bacterium]